MLVFSRNANNAITMNNIVVSNNDLQYLNVPYDIEFWHNPRLISRGSTLFTFMIYFLWLNCCFDMQEVNVCHMEYMEYIIMIQAEIHNESR